MNVRTLGELEDAVRVAKGISDTKTLLQCAVELDALGTTQARASSANARGIAELLSDNYAGALEFFHAALSLLDELGDRSGVARATGNIGSVYLGTGNYKAAHENYHRSLEVHTALGNLNGVAVMSMGIGNVYKETGDFATALEFYHHALQLYKECNDPIGEAGVSRGIANVHSATGNYPVALEFYHRALNLHEELGDRRGVALVTSSIGLVDNRTGHYAEALEHYHRALAVLEELGAQQDIAQVCSNIGSVHGNTGNNSAALEYFRRALPLFEEMGDQSGVAGVTSNITSALAHSGSFAEAEEHLQKLDAMDILVPGIILTREQTRAILQEQTGNIDDAIATLQAALELARAHGLSSEQAEFHKALREICQKKNDFTGYIEHNNEFTRITEEINGKDTATKLAMQEKQREIDAVQREHQKHMAVLHSTLPKNIADRVARGEVVNDHHENVAVIFLDIVGFTDLSSQLDSRIVIEILDDVFSKCDAICAKHQVTKIKTIGDSYMTVAFGTANAEQRTANQIANSEQRIANQIANSEQRIANPAVRAASAAREMMNITLNEALNEALNKALIKFRIGIHCGPVTAGVIGKERMQYDVWGDTVNVASRMESTSEPGKIHISQAFNEALNEAHTVPRGEMEIKGKGLMPTYWLEN
ncbi:MAG TPA: adenylate/guanylate cyclase domain-containing protein [Candidatus Didemnitutus sp.]|nr:adenylate/guanylate cyclase domain-containing protein [Candidatus Didemnitutus sp.]